MNIRLSFKLIIVVPAFAIAFQSEAKAGTLTEQQQVRAPIFSISTVNNLRTAMKGIRPVKITGSSVTLEPMPFASVVGTMPSTTAPIMGTVANPYASPQGLVLSINHPQDPTTQSSLSVNGMRYDYPVLKKLLANDPQTCASTNITKESSYDGGFLCYAYFKGLPAGRHTYAISLGMTYSGGRGIEIWDMTSRIVLLSQSQLVWNVATLESRGLLLLDQPNITLGVLVKPYNLDVGCNLHHLQMTCLDCQ